MKITIQRFCNGCKKLMLEYEGVWKQELFYVKHYCEECKNGKYMVDK